MGYPPPPRRGNDKKRYYYSNNPNRRHNNSGYSHRPYGPSYSSYPTSQSTGEVRTHSSQDPHINLSRGSTSLPQSSSDSHIAGLGSSDSNRPSRYNQTSSTSALPQSHRPVSTPTALSGLNIPTTPSSSSFGKYGSSRYNNDSNDYVHQPIPTHTSSQIQNGISSNATDANVPSKSRYSSTTPSRYNASSNGTAGHTVPTGPSNGNQTPTKPSSNVPYIPGRHRPQSVDSSSSTSSFDPHYNYSSHQQSTAIPSYPSGNNAGPNTFFNRRNKWGSHGQYQPSSSGSDKYPSSQFQGSRSNFWRGSHPTHSNSVGAIDALPHDSRFTHDIDEQSTDSSISELQLENKRTVAPSMKGNLSPGGSLIRSVPLITKELSEQMSLEHRNTSLSRSRTDTPIESMNPSEADDKSVDVESTEVSSKAEKDGNLWTVDIKKEIEEEIAEEIEENKQETENPSSTIDEAITEDENKALNEKQTLIEEDAETNPQETTSLQKVYQYVSDPVALKTDITKLTVPDHSGPFKSVFPEQEAYIFPLNETETKLWDLKHRTRSGIIAKQKYLLKNPIKSLKEYSFFNENIQNHKTVVENGLSKAIQKINKFNSINKLKLRKIAVEYSDEWKKECKTMEEVTNDVRRNEREYRKKQEEERIEKEKKEKELHEQSLGLSRRRNRADFVDDTDMESVMLQIDPDYKHIQAAAVIPSLHLDPIERFSCKFQNVVNLKTDKNEWASRLLTDGIDTFSEHEHELFVEGYLSHPKKFGKISHHMGNLRSPEDCVLHYYRTKRSVDYKKLLLNKNKRRKSEAAAKRRNKKKEKSLEVEDAPNQKADVHTAEEPAGEINTKNIVENELPVVSKSVTPVMTETVVHAPTPSPQTQTIVVENMDASTAGNIEATEMQTTTSTDAKVVTEKFEPSVATEPEPATTATAQQPPLADNMVPPQKRDYATMEAYEETNKLPQIPVPPSSLARDDTIVLDNPESFFEGDNPHKKKGKIIHDHKSSYWSVKESQAFPELLEKYGSQWSTISEKLSTKSTTMVRNYYQRNAAQFGWKAIVAEADTRRNVEVSDSMQQTQMLLQTEQTNPVVANGIPSQQKPALGLFSSATDQQSAGMDAPQGYPFNSEVQRDSFSLESTPTGALPPPRLPSIQLNPTATGQTARQPLVSPTDALSIVSLTSDATHASASTVPSNVSQRESGTRTSISDIMNNDSGAAHPAPIARGYTPPPVRRSTDIGINNFLNGGPTGDTRPAPLTSPLAANAANAANADSAGSRSTTPVTPVTNSHIDTRIVVQEMSNETARPMVSEMESAPHPRLSSISALLNPVSSMRTQPQPQPQMPQQTQQPQAPAATSPYSQEQATPKSIAHQDPQPRVANYNFANDPLAALAAVASAPETLASMLPEQRGASSQPK